MCTVYKIWCAYDSARYTGRPPADLCDKDPVGGQPGTTRQRMCPCMRFAAPTTAPTFKPPTWAPTFAPSSVVRQQDFASAVPGLASSQLCLREVVSTCGSCDPGSALGEGCPFGSTAKNNCDFVRLPFPHMHTCLPRADCCARDHNPLKM